jgi:hypothetical protein
MIGGLLGIGIVLNYLGAAWSGPGSEGNITDGGLISGLGAFVIFGLIGIFLFPRTVGMAFTPAIFAAPIAFILGWISTGFTYALGMLLFGVGAWAITFIIGKVRPESTY